LRDYGKVFTSFWSSQNIRDLSDDGRMLALYLMTSHHTTLIGAFRLPDGYVSEDLQWSNERVSQGFSELLMNGFSNRCETTKWVWITKHLEWNPPENPNQRKSAVKLAAQIPDQCGWKQAFMRVCGPAIGIDQPEKTNPSETVQEPFRNQKQEQEQEQEQEQKQKKKQRSTSSAISPGDLIADGLSEQEASDFLAHRKAKRSPLTQTAWEGIKAEANKVSLSASAVAVLCMQRGWIGFDSTWMSQHSTRSSPGISQRDEDRKKVADSIWKNYEKRNDQSDIVDVTPATVG
jgi:hypothetical protein